MFGIRMENLHIAVTMGDIEKVDQIIRCGCNINGKDKNGVTPLIFSIVNDRGDLANNRVAIAEKLLLSGADPNCPGGFEENPPLLWAVLFNNKCMVKMLIDYGANVNATCGVSVEHYGRSSALKRAAQKGDLEIIEILLNGGADIHQRDEHGITPIIATITSEDPRLSDALRIATIRLLLERGAVIGAGDIEGNASDIWLGVTGILPADGGSLPISAIDRKR